MFQSNATTHQCEWYAYDCDDDGATTGIVLGVISPHLILPGLYYCALDKKPSFMRCASLFNYFAFYPWLLLLILFLSGAIHVAGWVKLLPMVLTPFTYMFVFLESCCSYEHGFLSKPSSEGEANQFIDYMRTVKPEVSTHVECYHKERRTRTKKDSKGNTRTETYYVEVVTWSGNKIYEIPYWRDTSEPTPEFTATCNTRLTLPDLIHFADTESLNHFEADRDAFVEANRHRDNYIRFTTKRTIPGHIKRRMVCGRNYLPPRWMSLKYYWLAVVLHMTWPYRWKLNSSSEEKECYIVKEIACRPMAEPSAPYLAPPYMSPQPGPSVPPYMSTHSGPSVPPYMSPDSGPSVPPYMSPDSGPSVPPYTSPHSGPSAPSYTSPYPGTGSQEWRNYWAPFSSAPPPETAPPLYPPMAFSRGINPSLILPSYGDDPPSYEEATGGTGGGEGEMYTDEEDHEGGTGHQSFLNEAYAEHDPHAERK